LAADNGNRLFRRWLAQTERQLAEVVTRLEKQKALIFRSLERRGEDTAHAAFLLRQSLGLKALNEAHRDQLQDQMASCERFLASSEHDSSEHLAQLEYAVPRVTLVTILESLPSAERAGEPSLKDMERFRSRSGARHIHLSAPAVLTHQLFGSGLLS
jgi:hypothetical protein